MTTTELIKLLQEIEFGASGRPREIAILIDTAIFDSSERYQWISRPQITIDGTGDGIAGAELTLRID